MASYNNHPLPVPPPHGQQSQYDQYNDRSPLPPPPQTSHSTRAQRQYSQDPPYQPPQQQQQQPPVQQQAQRSERARPRSRGFSFRSDKSQKTEKSGSGNHTHRLSSAGLQETSAEKDAKRLHTKADPTLAMQEMEPSAVAAAAIDFAGRAPLSSFAHNLKDRAGNPIADPDRTNPTRPRMERPLDTIRGFEANIDGSYDKRGSIYGMDSQSIAPTRRSTYYGNPGRFPQASYYENGRANSSAYDLRQYGDSQYLDGYEPHSQHQGYGGGGGNMRSRAPRMQSTPLMNTHPAVNRTSVYPMPNNHRSNETFQTGSGNSGSYGEPAGYHTDPSSENSSLARRSPPKQRQAPMNDYGINFGQSQSTAYQPPTFDAMASQPRTLPEESYSRPPPPPQKDSGGVAGGLLRKGSKATAASSQRPDMGDKRKSWFSRRFSKNL